MARRSSLLACAVCVVALLALANVANVAFVPSAQPQSSLRGAQEESRLDQVAQAAILGAVLVAPEAAHAANSGYAVLQLGWAFFIISLGPAVLFWIYFNKPELL
ncbi:unnamed protein product [Polarella glacialis]|uniref:Uncharacterized protein n=1 Tax=Polarella glacialis TaxID=89957 RepID=A0A813KF98_POLGL|nr:unnamed protein product [Polarella glacialis]